MGYRVIGNTEEIFKGYETRSGLEGPFSFDRRILYYDPREGKYWDPRSDFYLSHEEFTEIQARSQV